MIEVGDTVRWHHGISNSRSAVSGFHCYEYKIGTVIERYGHILIIKTEDSRLISRKVNEVMRVIKEIITMEELEKEYFID